MLKNKFTITLKPDTAQASYMNMKEVELEVHVLNFADGSVRVTLPQMTAQYTHRYLSIDAFIQSMDDIMIVAQIKDIIERIAVTPKSTTLSILSPVYSRYDRVMLNDQTDSFGAKVFADFINSLKFDFVQFFDCHSAVLTNLVDNSINFEQDILLASFISEYKLDLLDDFNLIAPDKGAANKMPYADLIFGKTRDLTTGQITGMEIVYECPNVLKDYLVIDDICEGGRTFLELAKIFKSQPFYILSELNLYVTHGIFTNNALEKLLSYNSYNNIYVYFMKKSVYDQLSDELKKNIHVKILIDA